MIGQWPLGETRWVCLQHPEALVYRVGHGFGTSESTTAWGPYVCGVCGLACTGLVAAGLEGLAGPVPRCWVGGLPGSLGGELTGVSL